MLALAALHQQAKHSGLNVSLTKTKVQVFEGVLDEIVYVVHSILHHSTSFKSRPSQQALHDFTGLRPQDL